MLIFNHKIYSAMLSGSSYDYSPPETWELLGSATDLCVQIRAAQANETFDIKTDFEHSADGLVWEATGNSDAFTVDDSQVFSRFISWDASRLVQAPRYRRLRVWLVGVVSTEAVHLEIWAAGRGKAAQAPTAKGRPVPGVSALATSFLKNVAARPRCGRNAECGCGGKDGPCACGNASKDAPPLDLSGAVLQDLIVGIPRIPIQARDLVVGAFRSEAARRLGTRFTPQLRECCDSETRAETINASEIPLLSAITRAAGNAWLAVQAAPVGEWETTPGTDRGIDDALARERIYENAFRGLLFAYCAADPGCTLSLLAHHPTTLSELATCLLDLTREQRTVVANWDECVDQHGERACRNAPITDTSVWERMDRSWIGVQPLNALTPPLSCTYQRCTSYAPVGECPRASCAFPECIGTNCRSCCQFMDPANAGMCIADCCGGYRP
ncbi:MAG: hypothetical protein K8H88_19595 [Sandaracinaceae bacterium]|nr:hypothetical protein [Sandaracinaceae bacterium]